jgi:hypothetical protein
MSLKSIAAVGCIVLLSSGWLLAQSGANRDGAAAVADSSNSDRFKLTSLGKESAILLDVQTGDSWYLRDAGPGTVWLAILRINSKEELDEWRKKFDAIE